MRIQAVVSFLVHSRKLKKEVDLVLQRYGINDIPSDPPTHEAEEDVMVKYSFSVDYVPDFIEQLLSSLEIISVPPRNRKPTFRFHFVFSDEEYRSSPLFEVHSFGNDPKRYLENSERYEEKLFCTTCNRKIDEQVAPLVIDTAVVNKYDLVYVDKKLVVSEKIASLFEDWKLTGYRLEQVEHKGSEKNKYNAYQIIPTNILPPQEIPEVLKNDPHVLKLKCPACGTGGHLIFPYHYHESVIKQMKDFNLPHEYIALNSKKVSRTILFSANLKKLLIESKIADKNWDFIPTIVMR